MEFNPDKFDIQAGVLHWLTVSAIFTAVLLLAAFLISLISRGAQGPAIFGSALVGLLKDLFGVSVKRVLAITQLTFKEAIRRKALLIFVVFCILFMFAGWFLASSNNRAHEQVKLYVSFVLTAITWLLLVIMLLLSCWGIPEDIRLRSLHTVVTKPTRRIEIVLGRVLGFTSIGVLVLVIMGGAGYLWIRRQLDEQQKEVLTSRVPVYGPLEFLGDTGRPEVAGINVGDVWKHRSYVKGASAARAIWTFDGITESRLRRKAAFRASDIPKGSEAKVAEWMKSAGDEVRAGDPIATVEAGTSQITLNAPHDGRIVEILETEGSVVTAADPVVVMEYSSAKLEANFEAFRTYKGDMELGGLIAQYTLVNNSRADAFANIAKSNNFTLAANQLRLGRYQNAAELLRTLALKLAATENLDASREVTFVRGELESLTEAFEQAASVIEGLDSDPWADETAAAFRDCAKEASFIAESEGVDGDFSGLGEAVKTLSEKVKEHQASMGENLVRLAVSLPSVIVKEYRFGENVMDVPRRIAFTANNEDLVNFLAREFTQLSEAGKLATDGKLLTSLSEPLMESGVLNLDAASKATQLLIKLVQGGQLKVDGDKVIGADDKSMFVVLSDAVGNGTLSAEDNWRLTADLFVDIVNGESLRVEVACLSAGQYLGMAKPDLFIRLPDRPFESGYFKALAVIGMMMMLVVTVGVCASCFVKGPVAIFLTLSLLMIGQPISYQFLTDLVDRQIEGSGVLESAVRMGKQSNQQVELGVAPWLQKLIEIFDGGFFEFLSLVKNLIPNLEPFQQASGYIENGFDVPFTDCVLPSLMTLIGFVIPCVMIGLLSLRFRELEAK